MAQEKAPSYQWYPKDYETDEAVKLMTYEQEGVYRRLLDHQALHGGIPEDVRQIAALCPKVTAKQFLSRIWPAVQGKFTSVGPGRLVNTKLYAVQEKTKAFKAEATAAGKASAAARLASNGTAQPARTEPERNTERDVREPVRTDVEPSSAFAFASPEEQRQDCGVPNGQSLVEQVIADYKAKHPRNRGRFY